MKLGCMGTQYICLQLAVRPAHLIVLLTLHGELRTPSMEREAKWPPKLPNLMLHCKPLLCCAWVGRPSGLSKRPLQHKSLALQTQYKIGKLSASQHIPTGRLVLPPVKGLQVPTYATGSAPGPWAAPGAGHCAATEAGRRL